MWTLDSWFLWAAIAVQLVGVASVVAARTSQDSTLESCFQYVFLGCLLLVSLTTAVALLHSQSCWFSCGMVLAIMAVGATLDCRRAPQPAEV